MDLLDGGQYLNTIFLMLAIISLIMSFVFYKKSIKEKKLVFLSRSFNLLNNSLSSLPELKIEYNNQLVKQLTLTKISIWNSGKETINESDVANGDYLKISASSEVIFYSSNIDFANRKINELKIFSNENEIKIGFDFLDYSDGGIIDIYHNGKETTEFKVSGTIKGGVPISYGKISEYKITNSIGHFLLPSYWSAKFEELSKLDKFICTMLLPVGLIIMFIFMPLEGILQKFRTNIPLEYNLSGVSIKELHDNKNET